MSQIQKNMTRARLAAVVVKKLEEKGLSAVLVGGSVVSIYTDNKYESRDLDFISPDDHKKIAEAMSELGFSARGKDFIHPNTEFSVEFPSGPIAIGDEVPVEPEASFTMEGTTVKLLSPTQSAMDRLASYYFFNDRQCLDQAILICRTQEVNFEKLKAWSEREKELEKYNIFLNLL